MNSDDFEKRLQSQPLRQVPPEWRAGILRTAAAADAQRPVESSPSIGLVKLWRELIWPVRRIWIAFVCVWVAIVAVNFADTDKPGQLEARVKIPPGNLITVWQRQQELLTEFNNPENADMDKPKPNLPRPRSDRRSSEAIV